MDKGDGQNTDNAQGELLVRLCLGDAQTTLGSASNGKRHLPHPTPKRCWTVPVCLSKAPSLWCLVPAGPLEGSAEPLPPALVLPGDLRSCSGYYDHYWASLCGGEARWWWCGFMS